jgi:diguanylate cyclase (GGDEF)-like protein
MPPLVTAALLLRRSFREALPLAGATAFAAAVVLDARSPWPSLVAVPAAALLATGFAWLVRKRLKSIEASRLLDFQMGALAVVAAFGTVIRLDGSLDASVYPIVYVCIALLSAMARPIAALSLVLVAGSLELAIRYAVTGSLRFEPLAPHLGFMAVFAALNAVLLRAEIARVRRASRSDVQAEVERLRSDARSFRLLGVPEAPQSRPRQDDEERIFRSGVEEIHQSVLLALRLLRESLSLHTAMLLWENDAGTHFRISELVTDAECLAEGPFLAGDGIVGATITRRAIVSISGLKPGYKLPYYAGPCPVRAVSAIPVFEHGIVRGMLVVDRIDDRPLSPREEELVEEASRYAVRAIQNERVFAQLERAKVEQGKLYRAAEALGAATTEPDVVDAGVKSACEIATVDFAAVTLFDEATKTHEIRAVSGESVGDLVGQRFRHNQGLVSMVLENRHPLPYRGEYDEARQIVFTKRVTPPAMPSMVVLPLIVHEQPLGTLVLGSKRRMAFNDAARSTLEVLASHMAMSLSNARMLRRLEELATMDGLTGLLNKRAMLEIAAQKLLSAKRFERHLSVLIADIDFFKKVNDTHGHDVGDVVIKGLGEILRRAKRSTDSVARFGGEEFVVICEETDARGAMLLAERIREELARTSFHVPTGQGGPIQVTCSVGIATFPGVATTWEELFKAADEALYVSKRSGRNRSTASSACRSSTRGAA